MVGFSCLCTLTLMDYKIMAKVVDLHLAMRHSDILSNSFPSSFPHPPDADEIWPDRGSLFNPSFVLAAGRRRQRTAFFLRFLVSVLLFARFTYFVANSLDSTQTVVLTNVRPSVLELCSPYGSIEHSVCTSKRHLWHFF